MTFVSGLRLHWRHQGTLGGTMTRRLWLLAPMSLLPVVLLLGACSDNNADSLSDAIVAGAGRLRSSGQTQTFVRWQPSAAKPYVVAVYPPFRSPADEKFLDTIANRTLELSHAGAAISPKSEGFLNTVVVKPDGSAIEVTLKREGASVYITALR